jgi:hypothetical protein
VIIQGKGTFGHYWIAGSVPNNIQEWSWRAAVKIVQTSVPFGI